MVKETGGDAAHSAAQRSVSLKRKRDESDKSLEVISKEGMDVVVGDKLVFERQKRLHRFIEGVNPQSLWSYQFPIGELADRVSHYSGDMRLTWRTGVEGMEKFIQIVASRLLCVGCATKLLGAEQQVVVDKVVSLE
ncbi:uncharacterized protein [Arachis hypogaea]|uniref:uncharacterized protein n=1 Tax=Arachis hypogaea TaxID=3818 RepID=UPI003B215904